MKHPRSLVRASGPRRGRSRTPRVTGSGGGRIRDRFGLLLGLLIGAFIAQGLGTGLWARVLISALQFAALLAAFYSSGVLIGRPSYLVLGLAGLVAFGASAVQASTGALFALSSITGLVVVSAMLVSVALRVLRHNRVTSQTLLGAVCAYLLLGFLFADLYGAFDALSAQPLFGEQVPRAVYSYFSFVTLTTVGFGDYTARASWPGGSSTWRRCSGRCTSPPPSPASSPCTGDRPGTAHNRRARRAPTLSRLPPGTLRRAASRRPSWTLTTGIHPGEVTAVRPALATIAP